MSITQKTIAALVAVFLALLAGSALILDRAVRPNFDRLEQSEHDRDRTRVRANLDAVLEDLRGRAFDYGNWDDTYAFLAGADPGYVDDFSDTWFDDYGIDVVAFGDLSNGVVWAKGRPGAGQQAIDRGGAAALVAQAAPNESDAQTGVVWLEELGFVAFAAAPVTNSDATAPARGSVLIGQRLSQDALKVQAQLEIELLRADDPTVSRHASLMDDQGDRLTWTAAHEIVSFIPLRDAHGGLVGAMLTRKAREIAALGSTSIAVALALFMAVSAALIAALWFVFRKAVIRRIKRLEQHFNAQGGDPEPLADEARRHDEISRLTEAYNALAARFRDAKEREQVAETQREAEAAANRMKSDFLANISHELRTPLNAVIGYTDLIAEDLEAGEADTIPQDLDRISQAARHLLTLVNEVLDLSKIEAGKIEIKPSAFDADSMIEDLDAIVEPLASARSKTFRIVTSHDLGVAYTDQTRLRQCLSSVISTICRLSEGGVVELHARREGSTLHFEVRDQRRVLSAAELHRLFEPFVHSDANSSGRDNGAGLGLAITRKLMMLLGGRIDVDSAPGRGTTFKLIASAAYDERGMAPARAVA